MKEVFEVRANSIYTAGEGELVPKIELVLVHTDGRQYTVAEGGKVKTIPILRETRMIVGETQLDEIIADLQKWKMQMVAIKQNCTVMNDIVKHLQKPSESI